MSMFISVIISTYNPDIGRLTQTLEGLKNQTLETELWELIIVNNNSSTDILNNIDIYWHPYFKIVKEPRQGLTNARLKGFGEAKGNILVMVDDDNVLGREYLANTLTLFNKYPDLGAAGGKSVPVFEAQPPGWIDQFYGNLALRDLGNEVLFAQWDNTYPTSAPIGAGMAIRTKALMSYLSKALSGQLLIGDRIGNSLSSGGDNDIVLEILKSGWKVGYFPSLGLQHIIPADRLQVAYLSELVRQTNLSWVRLLEEHGINPWSKISKWTVPLRNLKAWFNYQAWKGEEQYIKWQGACGTFKGLSVRKK
ncbi:MAG: glycosyltransferase [Mucilaginibacter sp.]